MGEYAGLDEGYTTVASSDNSARLEFRVAVIANFHLMIVSSPRGSKTGFLAVDSAGALQMSPTSPTVELSSQANFRPSSLVGGVSEGAEDTNAEGWTRATQQSRRRAV